MTGASDWSGPIGSIWATEWERTDRSFAELSLTLDAVVKGHVGGAAMRVVDIGCGAGATSIALARARPQAMITGVDISADLIEVAKRRAGDLGNLSFAIGPAEQVAADLAPVDLFISRHGVMFFPDPVAAFTKLRAAAAPGASIIFSCFRRPADNPWASALIEAIGAPTPAAPGYVPGPFAFAEPGFVADVLTKAGWILPAPRAVDYGYRAGGGADPVEDALAFFKRIGPTANFLRNAEGAERDAAIDRLRVLLEACRSGDAVDFPAAAWLWSAKAA